MAKRIVTVKPGEFGFNDIISERTPIERRYWAQQADDVLPQFGDSNVKPDLEEAKKIGGFVLLVNSTPTTYSATRIYACPDCGMPMRRQASKKEERYVCKHNETRRELGLKDDKHAYVRSWTREELA